MLVESYQQRAQGSALVYSLKYSMATSNLHVVLLQPTITVGLTVRKKGLQGFCPIAFLEF